MKHIAKLIVAGTIAGAIAGTIIGAAGSVAAGSTGKSAVPQKDPLAARPAPAPKSKAIAGAARGRTGTGEQAPRLGIERAAPERQLPEAPVAAAAGPAEGNETE